MYFKELSDCINFFSILEKETSEDMIEVIATEGNTKEEVASPEFVPLLVVKNIVLFPGVIIPVTIKQQKAIQLAQNAYKKGSIIGIVAQKKLAVAEPGAQDIFHIGALAKVIKVIIFPDGHTTIILKGGQKFQVDKIIKRKSNLSYSTKNANEKCCSG